MPCPIVQGMFRRHLPAIVLATIVVVAFAGTQAGLGAGTPDSWSSSLKTGDVVPRGTVWQVTVTPTPDEVDFWASDRVIATDRSAPFEVPLDLVPGDYKLGFCYRKDGVQKCATTETGAGEGIVARVKIVDPTPAPTPPVRLPRRRHDPPHRRPRARRPTRCHSTPAPTAPTSVHELCVRRSGLPQGRSPDRRHRCRRVVGEGHMAVVARQRRA